MFADMRGSCVHELQELIVREARARRAHQDTVQDLLDRGRDERNAKFLILRSTVMEFGANPTAPEGKPGTDIALSVGADLKELLPE